MTTAVRITKVVQVQKQNLEKRKRDAERHKAEKKRQKTNEIGTRQKQIRRGFMAALEEIGGAEGVLKELETGFVNRNTLKVHLSDSALDWVKEGTGKNPLGSLFKDLRAQGFEVCYRSGYRTVAVGGGFHADGEYFPDHEYKRYDSPYIQIEFPKEDD